MSLRGQKDSRIGTSDRARREAEAWAGVLTPVTCALMWVLGFGGFHMDLQSGNQRPRSETGEKKTGFPGFPWGWEQGKGTIHSCADYLISSIIGNLPKAVRSLFLHTSPPPQTHTYHVVSQGSPLGEKKRENDADFIKIQ